MTNRNIKRCKRIQVPPTVHNLWRIHSRYGDIKAIHEKSGWSEPTISAALNDGCAQKKLQEIITKFYQERIEENKVFEKQQLAALS